MNLLQVGAPHTCTRLSSHWMPHNTPEIARAQPAIINKVCNK